MRKKLKFLLIVLIIFPLQIKASTLDIKIACPETAYPNDTIECKLTYTNELSLNALIAKYKLPSIIEYKDLTLNNAWNNYYNSNTGFVIGSETTSNNDIGTIKLKVSNNVKEYKEYTIELNSIDASDTNFNSISQNNITTTIKIIKKEESNHSTNDNNNKQPQNDKENAPVEKEETNLDNDSKLKSIELSYGKINFDPNIFEYKIIVPNEITTISIEAIPNSEKSKVTIEKPQELNIGDNKITIITEAEDKSISKYIIIVTREEKIEDIIINKEEGNSEAPNLNNITYLIILIAVILIIILFQKMLKRKSNNNQ